MTKLLALALVIAAGCSHSSASSGTAAHPNAAGGPTCEVVRDRLVAMMSAAQHAPTEAIDHVGETIRARCADDSWSADVRTCLVNATNATMKRCEDLLTPAQQQALHESFGDQKYKKKSEYNFDDDTIEGDLAKPDGDYVDGKKRSSDPCEGGQ